MSVRASVPDGASLAVMQVVEVLLRAGGVMPTRLLIEFTSRQRVRTAVASGAAVRVGSSTALPTVDRALRAANTVNGYLSHLSAAAHHGWELKNPPDRPEVVVPRGRRIDGRHRRTAVIRTRRELHLEAPATSRIQTVIDVALDHPFDEALAVADSALRHGVRHDDLVEAALRLHSGRTRVLRVVENATAAADNPFESVLRAIALDVSGLNLVPQVWIHDDARADLADAKLRLIVEADSFGFHSSRAALRRDIERYNDFAQRGWLLLRFSWEHVMLAPEYVRSQLEQVVALLCAQHSRQPAA